MITVCVLGAGIGGKIISYGIKKKYGDSVKVVLVGEESRVRPGLFYFNKKIPGICEKEVSVTYSKIGTGTLDDYQKKSRGVIDSEVKISSFDKIGKTVTGYLLNREVDLSEIIRINENANKLVLSQKKLYTKSDEGTFDYLISTIPLKNFMSIINESLVTKYSPEFKYSPVYQYQINEIPEDSKIKSIRVSYDTSDSVFYRHSFYEQDKDHWSMVSESITDFENRTSVIYPGKIIPSKVLSEFVDSIEGTCDYFKFCGRYSRWDYHYTVDQSYEDAMKFLENKGLTSRN